MKRNLLSSAGLMLFASLGLGSTATAGEAPMPGSLLVFPEFDNRSGVMNLLTVTNTMDGNVFGGGHHDDRDPAGTINVEFVYINKQDCEEFNRMERLTPNDTLSVLSRYHNPQQEQGYVYVFARDRSTGEAIKHDWLIGNNLIIDGLGKFDYSTNVFSFKAGEALADGDDTDLDGDRIRDLNGLEYQEAPDQILIPRFIGQSSERNRYNQLILLNLSGGREFDTTINIWIYNDNEEVFSEMWQFRCWTKVRLVNISRVFENDFLLYSTNHDYREIAGAPSLKTGWIRLDGNVANSRSTSIMDPAFLAVMIEKVGDFASADLPFVSGSQDNGDLLPRGTGGDVIN